MRLSTCNRTENHLIALEYVGFPLQQGMGVRLDQLFNLQGKWSSHVHIREAATVWAGPRENDQLELAWRKSAQGLVGGKPALGNIFL